MEALAQRAASLNCGTRHSASGATGPRDRRAACAWSVGLALALMGAAVPAQGLYKVVGADGRVTYTDRPPSEAQQPRARWTPVQPGTDGGQASAAPALPAALRQVAQRYPVTLYTSAGCDPCDAARQLLTARGVPFTERTISTATDAQALQQRTGSRTSPSATIGAQVLVGLNDAEWGSYLDAAGYPRTSQLPNGYRQAAAMPLTPPPPAPAAQTTAAAPQAGETAPADGPPAVTPTRPGPGGIRF